MWMCGGAGMIIICNDTCEPAINDIWQLQRFDANIFFVSVSFVSLWKA